MIYSNSVITDKKAFTVQTELMPKNRLILYGLHQDDTHIASEYLPKVADFSIHLKK